MSKKLRRFLMLTLGIVFLAGTALMLRQTAQYRAAQTSQNQALEVLEAARQPRDPQETTPTPVESPTSPELVPVVATALSPLDPEVEFLLDLELDSLRQVNPDVIGWIHIPGGSISHPLLRPEDNEKYLTHGWDGNYSVSGSIFLECKNRMNFLDYNTIIYGHHMYDGSFFAPLLDYKDQSHRDAYPYVYLVTQTDLRRYEIFAAYEAQVDSDTFRLYFPDEAARQTALEHYLASSVLAPAGSPTTDDYILTLSTCTGTGNYTLRWVVQAKLTGIWMR